MKKYINEEELLDNIGILYEYHKEQMNFVAYSTIEDVCQIIDDMPSEDVVEVIRCKHCQYWTGKDYDGCCIKNGLATRYANDFCSYGERKEL